LDHHSGSCRVRFETTRPFTAVGLQELDAIHHLLRREDLGNQHRASDEQPDGRIGRREQDARVRHSGGVQAQVIGIGGDQDLPVCRCEGEQAGVGGAELPRFSSRRRVDPTRTQADGRPRSGCARR
jgi:hypothetical protein